MRLNYKFHPFPSVIHQFPSINIAQMLVMAFFRKFLSKVFFLILIFDVCGIMKNLLIEFFKCISETIR